MAAHQPLGPGALVGGDFRVIQPLGAGGMGAVYVVEQLSTGSRRALKVMEPHLIPSAEMRERFANEARIGARIESDHVVQVLAAGVDETYGIPWLAMELLQGESLANNVRRHGRFHPAKVAEVVIQLSHALAAAHRVGVVHRDLKPENVFLAAPRREGVPFTVKVLDFGIAKLIQGATSSMTASLGTPLWMAPEQTTPGDEVAAGTDIWAVGLLVFWMLTGSVYWRSARTHPPSLPSLMREVVLDPIEPASSRAAELGVSGVFNPSLDAWFATCLQRDGARRFGDVVQCRDALIRALPVASHHPSTGPSDPAFVQSSPMANTVPAAYPAASPVRDVPPAAHAVPPPAPTVDAGKPPQPPRRRSLLPHVSILTCGTLALALIGSCVSIVLYGTYKADKIAMPVIRRHHVVGFQPRRFDPSAFLSIATDLAREHDPSAQLVRISVTGVGPGDTVDLVNEGDEGSRSAVYSFRADRAHQDYCSINVIVDGDGVTSNQTKSGLCSWPALPEPECSVAEVHDKAVDAGANPKLRQTLAYQSFDGGKPGWAVMAGGFSEVLPDNCP